ncbi:MAG: hypothetical protein APF84_11170 [Gracilibacter sp. BRH_c7a]|nr:MAG: hypothetical protein APF84_11170 [Gracilibacter sp. BRH_c7a]
MSNSLPLVIVGSGGAAVNAVKAIRENSYQGEVHLFSDGVQPPFNPMLLTYYLGGKIPLEKCYLFGNSFDFFQKYRVNLHSGRPITMLDVKEKLVIDDQGQKVNYDSCLIASGASAIVPPVFGSKSQRVFSIRTIEDAVRLRELYLTRPRKVLLIGASMVGIKLVEIFQETGSEVFLVDLAHHVFAQAAHPECATVMEEQLQKHGINLILNTKVEAIEESKEGLKVNLAESGLELEVDLLVFCIGVRPNLEYIQPGQLEIEKGILVDNRMRASAGNVYVAGDVVQGLNLINQKKEVLALWANACQQGRIAGANMAGADVIYPGSIPQNITHFFDMFFVSIGDVHNYDEIERRHGNNAFSFFFKSKGRIIGVNFLTLGNYEWINSIGIIRYEILKTLNYHDPSGPQRGFPAETIINLQKVMKSGVMEVE